ncbi:MAG: hypothetical protein EA397_03680 [Deltaproteobacteria bacterium]|nr:MAG: hypothetical protein EA397_03680 [Deltaproteobacteria bacterium]
MIHLVFLFTLYLGGTAHASDRAEVEALLARAQDALASADANADYRAAAGSLNQAITALEGSSVPTRDPRLSKSEVFAQAQHQRCVDMGIQSYVGHQATRRRELAMAACPMSIDADILELALEVYRPGRAPNVAFTHAVKVASDEELLGKRGLLSFIYEQYLPGRNRVTALERAIRDAQATPAVLESCVRRAFADYLPGRNRVSALSNALRLCNPSGD